MTLRCLVAALSIVLACGLLALTVPQGRADGAPRPGNRKPPPNLTWPASGPITTYFGEVGPYSPRGHSGLDISAPWGAPVRAAAKGRVLEAGWSPWGYGYYVVLRHSGGVRTLYAHLSEIQVELRQRVGRGRGIGLIGSTGYATGAHLHFEVRRRGVLRDPLAYLP